MILRNLIRRILPYEEERRYADFGESVERVRCARATLGTYRGEPRQEKILVSLTSFPARFEYIHYTLESILCQTMRPDALFLYLDEEVDLGHLPTSLTSLTSCGLIIERRPLDLKPHKKYYYAMLEHPDDLVITVDDDLIYPENLIAELYAMHLRHPQSVVAARAHRIRFDGDGEVVGYRDWSWEDGAVGEPSLELCATGTGGVLYPPHLMHEDLFDCELISRLSPRNDDLWLKAMQVLVGTKTVLVDQAVRRGRAIVDGSQETSLNSSNVHQDANDAYIAAICSHYGITRASFAE